MLAPIRRNGAEMRSIGRRWIEASPAKMLRRAREARTNLPPRFGRPTQLVELLVPVADRPGAIAEVANTATELDVNILDMEIMHSAEGPAGVLHLVIEADQAANLRAGLAGRGFVTSLRTLV